MPLSKQLQGTIWASGRLFGLLLLVVLAAGCGGRIYPVHGRIVDTEGNPITNMKDGSVEFESEEGEMSANGSIDEEGKFRLTTEKAGDGAVLGKHKVAIIRPYINVDTPAPHVIDPKYERFETSGLTAVVEPKTNEITLTVERVKRRPR